MPLLFNMVLEVQVSATRQGKQNKIQFGKGDTKPSLFEDDVILNMKNHKDNIKNLLEFIEVIGYKINIQRHFAFHTLILNYQKEELNLI